MKKLLISVLLCMSLFIAGCGDVSPSTTDSVDYSSSSAVANSNDSSKNTKTLALPKNLDELAQKYCFKINGIAISLPTTYDEMRTVGYSTDGYITSDTVKANTVTGSEIHNSDGLRMNIELFGSKDSDVSREEAKIISVDVRDINGYAQGIIFETADGISLGDSIEKVEQLYGEKRKEIELSGGGFKVDTSFALKMKEQGIIDQDQYSSIAHEGLSFTADKSGTINHIYMTFDMQS